MKTKLVTRSNEPSSMLVTATPVYKPLKDFTLLTRQCDFVEDDEEDLLVVPFSVESLLCLQGEWNYNMNRELNTAVAAELGYYDICEASLFFTEVVPTFDYDILSAALMTKWKSNLVVNPGRFVFFELISPSTNEVRLLTVETRFLSFVVMDDNAVSFNEPVQLVTESQITLPEVALTVLPSPESKVVAGGFGYGHTESWAIRLGNGKVLKLHPKFRISKYGISNSNN